MTNKDYEQKRAECWEEYCKTHPLCNTHVMRLNFDWIFDRAFALGKQAAELSSNSEQLNAEGEDEMLCVSRKEIQQLVAANDVVILGAAGIDNIETIQAKTVNTILNRLFGSKCLPDVNEDNFAKSEPKFKVGDKAKFRGQKVIVTDLEEGGYVLIHTPDGSAYGITESDLEPYTEPKENIADPRNLSQDCDNHFDNIIKDSFSKERRLNIAAMAMQGIISNSHPKMVDMPIDRVVQLADAMASMLIAECEKGGEK